MNLNDDNLPKLNLPWVDFRYSERAQKKLIFDTIRKKFVTLTPEEWVRQHFVYYLHRNFNIPLSHIALETDLELNGLRKRADIVVYNSAMKPCVIIECKAPSINIKQEVFDQASRYNMVLRVPYLAITNGLQHYCAKINHQLGEFEFVETLPNYSAL